MPQDDVTKLLIDWSRGDPDALEKLTPLVYDELHRLAACAMRRERADHTLQPTALIHEAYLLLIDQNRVEWRNRTQFFAVAARLMRRVILHHARRLGAVKRGGKSLKVPLDEIPAPEAVSVEDLLALDGTLTRLQELDPRQAQLVELRFFAGLTGREIGEVMGISRATVDREWRLVRAWLTRELGSGLARRRPRGEPNGEVG